MLSGEATNTNLIVFDLTRSGLEPMIYRTRGGNANNYTSNAVQMISAWLTCVLINRPNNKNMKDLMPPIG